jgi:CheY-like chemotaxis protein
MASGTVLYVEDEEFDVVFMARAFKQANLDQSLQVVVDGQQAIDYLAGKPPYTDRSRHPLPAVILLDLNLPLVSGFEVLKWLRQQPPYEALPVVVFSSSARGEDQQKATELGANAYVQKPSSGLDFVDVVQQLKQQWLAMPELRQ